jgi:hypothetical protein
MGLISFEEIIFLRIAFEFSKIYRSERSEAYQEQIDQACVTFDEYFLIFQYLSGDSKLNYGLGGEDGSSLCPDRVIFSEWVKFSLQLSIEDEVTRRNLVSLMFNFIGQIHHSLRDYEHMLKYGRIVIGDCEARTLELAMDTATEMVGGSNWQDEGEEES